MSDTHDARKSEDHPTNVSSPHFNPLTTLNSPSFQSNQQGGSFDVSILPEGQYSQNDMQMNMQGRDGGDGRTGEEEGDGITDEMLNGMVDFDAAFDPDTLANLAALSRIQGMDDEEEEGVQEATEATEGEGTGDGHVDFSLFLPGLPAEDQAADTDATTERAEQTTSEQVATVKDSTSALVPDEQALARNAESASNGVSAPETKVESRDTVSDVTAPVESSSAAVAGETSNIPAPADQDAPQPPSTDGANNAEQPFTLSASEATSQSVAPISSDDRPNVDSATLVQATSHDKENERITLESVIDSSLIDPSLLDPPFSRDASTVPDTEPLSERTDIHNKRDRDGEGDEGERNGDGDDDYQESNHNYEEGKTKRRRQRTVLSCTECHRRCDRQIPCNRCIKRGVPSMCRMELPPVPERKKRKMEKDAPASYELGVRVQALESLIRSGSTLDPDSASSAAMETILHATRAAELGSSDATSALAQLTDAMGGQGIGGMSQDAQSSLLMDVLQQLSVAGTAKPIEESTEKVSKTNGRQDMWSSIALPRPDNMTRIAAAYEDDTSATKVNLSLPGFREDEGKIFVPPTVRYVEKQMQLESMLCAEALPAWGDERFLSAAIKFAYGVDEKRYSQEHVSAVQAISLTGALRLAGTFLSRIPTRGRQVYLPSPAVDEDVRTLRDAGLDVRFYRFLDRKTGNVDFDGLREDIMTAPERSAILLFVSGSMPTGLDLSSAQWKSLTVLLQQRSLIPLVVMAFQGLATGDPAQDAEPLRLMAHEGLPVVLCQTFDATMGLYADSPAVVSVLTQSVESKERVDGQLRGVARGLYLHPSPWGGFVGRQILSDPKLHPAWLVEIKAMADRLRSVREKLHDLLATKFKTPGSWIHIKKSVGMYCTTLLPPAVNDSLTSKRHIHLLPHGSISLGTLNSPKIELLARAIDSVVLAYNRELEEAQAQQLAMQIALAAAREAAAREEEEAEAQAAEDEDRMLLEQDLVSAIEAQTRAEEDERRREEEERGLEDAVRRAAERAETARAAEAILASITAGQGF